MCVWTSENSLDDGIYTYSVVVTTITQAAPLHGSFNIGILNSIANLEQDICVCGYACVNVCMWVYTCVLCVHMRMGIFLITLAAF
jgi:hypothetical protein